MSLWQLLEQPWTLLGRFGAEAKLEYQAGTGPALYSSSETAPLCSGTGCTLPPKVVPFAVKNGTARIYSLPAEDRDLKLQIGPTSVVLSPNGAIPRPTRREIAKTRQTESSGPTGENPDSVLLYRFIDALVGVMQELRWLGEKQVGKTTIMSPSRMDVVPLYWQTVVDELIPDGNQPRMELIVRLATSFGDRLLHLSKSPRKVLRRVRRRENLARVQQLDSQCLAWFARQPGRTRPEKAGPKQEVLAVVRTEDYNTLENQVLKDTLVRCVRAADDYRINQRKYHRSKRYIDVMRFRLRCLHALQDERIQSIGDLHSKAQPNYVLQFDKSYRELWLWYTRLVARESDTDTAWLWQGRLWEDACALLTSAAMLKHTGARDAALLRNQNLWLRREQHYGSWLAPDDWPGPMKLAFEKRTVIAEFVHPLGLDPQETTHLGIDINKTIGVLGASFAVMLTVVGMAEPMVLVIWAIQRAQTRVTDEDILSLCQEAAAAASTLQSLTPKKLSLWGIVLASDFASDYTEINDFQVASKSDSRVYGVRLPGGIDEWGRGVLSLLGDIIDDCLDQLGQDS